MQHTIHCSNDHIHIRTRYSFSHLICDKEQSQLRKTFKVESFCLQAIECLLHPLLSNQYFSYSNTVVMNSLG